MTLHNKEGEVLGKNVTERGPETASGHVASIKELREPKNVTEIIQFLGLLTYLLYLIQNFTNREICLYGIMKRTGLNLQKKEKKLHFIYRLEREMGLDINSSVYGS